MESQIGFYRCTGALPVDENKQVIYKHTIDQLGLSFHNLFPFDSTPGFCVLELMPSISLDQKQKARAKSTGFNKIDYLSGGFLASYLEWLQYAANDHFLH